MLKPVIIITPITTRSSPLTFGLFVGGGGAGAGTEGGAGQSTATAEAGDAARSADDRRPLAIVAAGQAEGGAAAAIC